MIWNLDLASTRSSVHSARIVRIVNSLSRNAISISNGLFSWDMRWGAYIFQPRKVNLPQKAPFLSTNRDALPVNIRLIVCSEHNYVHARIDNITLGGHGRRSLCDNITFHSWSPVWKVQAIRKVDDKKHQIYSSQTKRLYIYEHITTLKGSQVIGCVLSLGAKIVSLWLFFENDAYNGSNIITRFSTQKNKHVSLFFTAFGASWGSSQYLTPTPLIRPDVQSKQVRESVKGNMQKRLGFWVGRGGGAHSNQFNRY